MTRFIGKIGYITTKETDPHVYEKVTTVVPFKGDLLHTSKRDINEEKVNEDIILNHRVSLVGDQFAFENFIYIKWVEYLGVKWRVSAVEILRPRIILNMRGVYDGE